MVIEAAETGQKQARKARKKDLQFPVPARDARGRLLPGQSLNPHGRIPKQKSVLDETKELAERRAKRIARAWVASMEQETSVGNRARADYRDTFHGVPKQTLVVQQAESPLMAMLAGWKEPAQVIEGESKLLQ